jgi:hypothetical protein
MPMNTGGIALSFLPQPGPLPLGEGATDAAVGLSERANPASDGRADSLSRRERAGVRENGVQVCGLAVAINSITIIKNSKTDLPLHT